MRDGTTYHVLPGGEVEDGESAAEAARREAHEELGVLVKIRGLVAVVHYGLRTQQYFLAEPIGGEFGTGAGPEMGSAAESEQGSYRAVWLPVSELLDRDLRPESVAAALTGAPDPEWLLDGWLGSPVVFEEV